MRNAVAASPLAPAPALAQADGNGAPFEVAVQAFKEGFAYLRP
jgi:hypothetical protein